MFQKFERRMEECLQLVFGSQISLMAEDQVRRIGSDRDDFGRAQEEQPQHDEVLGAGPARAMARIWWPDGGRWLATQLWRVWQGVSKMMWGVFLK